MKRRLTHFTIYSLVIVAFFGAAIFFENFMESGSSEKGKTTVNTEKGGSSSTFDEDKDKPDGPTPTKKPGNGADNSSGGGTGNQPGKNSSGTGSGNQDSGSPVTPEKGNYLETDIYGHSKETKDYTPLISQINEYLKDKKGRYGIYFRSLTTGQTFGINETDTYRTASTIKLPINLYLFDRIAKGLEDPETLVTYTSEDKEPGTGSIQYGDVGRQFTLRELSRLSIVQSDNVAINMLIRYFERENIRKYMTQVIGHEADFKYVSPVDMGIYMEAVLKLNKIYPKESEELLNSLKNTDFNDRIPLYLPKEVEVAHKIGNQVNVMNDVGVVFAQKPFVLSAMTKEIDIDEACEVIGRITKMIYDFEQK